MIGLILSAVFAFQPGAGPDTLPAEHSRILVVFYSRTGTTQQVAEALAAELNADIERIQDVRGRGGLFGYIRSGYEATRKLLPPIKPMTLDPAEYDLVVLGTPVWAGTMASPMRSYLAANPDRFRSIALFSTQGSETEGGTFQDMTALCGAVPKATLALRRESVIAGEYFDRLEEFAAAILSEMEQ